MARLQTVVDECLAVADAFVDISSSSYNELGATSWGDNDKNYPFFLFDKKSIEIAVNTFSRLNLPSRSTYNQTFYFFDTYDESEKSSTTLQAKQDALMVIADQYFAELRGRNASGQNGFYLASISLVPNDEALSDKLIQLTYSVEFIVQREDCSLGTFSYAGVEQPTNLACSSNSATSIDISWTDNATAETNYEVWRSSNGTDFTLLNTIAANSTSYSDTGLANETPYAYKVRAIDGTNNGKFSSQILCTTDSAGGACADAIVENSTQSYQVNVASGGTLVLPDITHVNPQGNNVVLPAQTPFNAITYKSGIAYQRIIETPQNTSYQTGDAGWHWQNGTYHNWTNPAYPLYYQRLDYASVYYGRILLYNNVWGHKQRFCSTTGGYYDWVSSGFVDVNGNGSNFATQFADGIIIDHLTGKGYKILSGTSQNWSATITAIHGITIGGYNDWRMPTINEANAFTIYDENLAPIAANFEPFKSLYSTMLIGSLQTWTSNTMPNGNTNALWWAWYSNNRLLNTAKTVNVYTLMVRDFY